MHVLDFPYFIDEFWGFDFFGCSKAKLKQAVPRIKILKNKKDALVKQIKRELARLLEIGQDRTARIRVEHLVREDKTRAACDLIQIYCELISERMPIIESQKNCPTDMKESISSVIFASSRCAADIPELTGICKHFRAKYGKEFIYAAVELCPDCGVHHLLVGRLSAKPPDGPTKIKILTAIAEEHKVKWDPDSFGDMLNGPNTFDIASKTHVEPPCGPSTPNCDDKEPPKVQVSPKNYENHSISMNFDEKNARSSPRFQDLVYRNVSANRATTFGRFHPDVRSSGTGADEMENRHSFPGDGNASALGMQNLKKKFEDAASAAQAAAESAEKASMAARVAVELSRQYSSKSRDKFSRSASSKTSTTSYFEDMRTGKQSIRYSFPSHSRNIIKDHTNVSTVPGENSFLSDVNIHESIKGKNSYGNHAPVFYDSGSDDDGNCKFDVEDYKGQGSSLYFSSSTENSFSVPSASLKAWSDEQKTNELQSNSISHLSSSSVQHFHPVVSRSLSCYTVSSQPNDFLPGTFDASDGQSSDSEEVLDTSKLVRNTDPTFSQEKTFQFTSNAGPSTKLTKRSQPFFSNPVRNYSSRTTVSSEPPGTSYFRKYPSRSSYGTETSKSSGSTMETPSKEKASHVHPKLPDYDDIVSKFMALRQSQQ